MASTDPHSDEVSVDLLLTAVRATPGQDVRALVETLFALGYRTASETRINDLLHNRADLFYSDRTNASRPRWYDAALVTSPRQARTSPIPRRPYSGPPPDRTPAGLTLYPWQERALEAWRAHGGRGVIEAVTGAGKTRVALAAATEQLAAGGKVVVVVPSVPLLGQWKKEFEDWVLPAFPGRRIGQLGGNQRSSAQRVDVLITTAASGADTYVFTLDRDCLVIADECHHYGASTWHKALQDPFKKRLGLTATYEREDDGLERYLDPYFGGVCYSVDYREALRDGVIARFKIAYVGIRFSPEEREIYDEASYKASRYRKQLIEQHNVKGEPFGEFMRQVQRLHAAGAGRAARCAGMYLNAFAQTRAALANAQNKMRRLSDLVPAIRVAERTILFSQTQNAAEEAVQTVTQSGIQGAVLHAGMNALSRTRVFASFESGEDELIAAPRLLDEGIDVPAADLAIILASSRSRRQMIQRMGRVLRKKEDNRLARIVVMYVEGTMEDPTQGGHETFLHLIREAAEDQRDFRPSSSAEEIVRYLNQHGGDQRAAIVQSPEDLRNGAHERADMHGRPEKRLVASSAARPSPQAPTSYIPTPRATARPLTRNEQFHRQLFPVIREVILTESHRLRRPVDRGDIALKLKDHAETHDVLLRHYHAKSPTRSFDGYCRNQVDWYSAKWTALERGQLSQEEEGTLHSVFRGVRRLERGGNEPLLYEATH